MATQDRAQLLEIDDLERSLSSDYGPLDRGLAEWTIEMVSAAALQITKQDWRDALDVPPGAMAAMAIAARRLYTNPDRFTREGDDGYSYGIDASATGAEIFTGAEEATLREFRRRQRPKGIGTIGTTRDDPMPTGRFVPDGSQRGFPWY